jgi:hypothetical protein
MLRGDPQLYADKEHQYAMASAPSVKAAFGGKADIVATGSDICF